MTARPLILASLLALSAWASAQAAEPVSAGPVVVELFTSQGCSSCPPADVYLGELAKKPGILALGFHVDYWNYIGWTDPYSLKLAAERQRNYAHRLGLHYVYTPQMVVGGTREGVGSERDKVEQLLRAAASEAPAGPAIALERHADEGIHVHVGSGSAAGAATVWLVGFDRARETKVLRGENEGVTAEDYQVVRSLSAVGQWNGAALDLDLRRDSAVGDNVAVLVQAGGTGAIVAAAKLAGSAP